MEEFSDRCCQDDGCTPEVTRFFFLHPITGRRVVRQRKAKLQAQRFSFIFLDVLSTLTGFILGFIRANYGFNFWCVHGFILLNARGLQGCQQTADGCGLPSAYASRVPSQNNAGHCLVREIFFRIALNTGEKNK